MGVRLLLARFFEEAGDTDKAVAQLEGIIALAPESLHNRNRLAAYYHSKGKTEQAEQVLRDAIALTPEDADAKLTPVRYLRDRGESKRSEQVLKEFISQSPVAYELQLGLAGTLIGADRKAEALEVLDRVIANAGESQMGMQARTKKASLLLAEGRHKQAAREVELVLEEDPRDTDALLVRAAISMTTDDPDRGIADLRTLLKERPGHVPALRLEARAHAAKNELALARQSLERAIEAEPQEISANVELTRLLIGSGDLDAAVAVLERMRRFGPDDQSILVTIAEVRMRQERWEDLGGVAALLIEQSPELAIGYYYRGLVLQAGGDHAGAILAFEESLQRKPNAFEPLIALAKSLLATGRAEDALARVQRVMDAKPDHFIALNLKGEIFLTLKRFDEAESAFEQAITLNPQWPLPYRNLARTAMRKGDARDARARLKAGFEATGDPAVGMEYAQLNLADNEQEARRVYKAILERQPGFVAARNNYAVLLVKGEPDREALDQALSLVADFATSNNPAYLDTLGWVRFKRNEPKQAVSSLQRAKDLLGERPVPAIAYHLAEAYAAVGRNAEAIELLETVVASNSRFEGMDRAAALLGQLQ